MIYKEKVVFAGPRVVAVPPPPMQPRIMVTLNPWYGCVFRVIVSPFEVRSVLLIM